MKHLLKHGVVYTIRKEKRKRVGKDWITTGRGNKKIADVNVEYVGMVEILYKGFGNWFGGVVFPDNKPKFMYDATLEDYVKHSGFNTVNAWIRELMRLNGIKTWKKMPIEWHLYKVTLVKKAEEERDG
uniref:Uncharacterized protein n=1 Tax=Pyrococcus abyssi TaxID=29292 RepID=A0A5J6XVI6_PYRAY|nr:hypothetical protein [Pyrococcus abyssi]